MMDTSRRDLLGELAADAALERGDFIVQAADQMRRFLEANRDRISDIGGLTLIDDEPDYLSIAPDLTFRSRTRYQDDETGEWMSETEVIESPGELVELYNPSDIYAAFTEAAREAAGLTGKPDGTDEEQDTADTGSEKEGSLGEAEVYAAAADEWAAAREAPLEADDDELAARRLYDLALEYQERSQRTESRLLEQFEESVTNLTERLGDLVIVDDDDERLVLTVVGGFRAEVVPEDAEGEWRALSSPDELVEYYDPTDVFGDLADAIAEAFPGVAPELTRDEAGEDEDLEGEDEDAEDLDEADEDEVAEASDRDASNGAGGPPRA
jgi:hypothetical protein